MNSVQQQINSLREALNHHNHHYYVLDNATISDYDFDIKLKELEALEAAHPEFYDVNSPSQRVGGSITKNFQTLLHKNRMYSLDNSYSKEDLLDWEKRLQKNLGHLGHAPLCYVRQHSEAMGLVQMQLPLHPCRAWLRPRHPDPRTVDH